MIKLFVSVQVGVVSTPTWWASWVADTSVGYIIAENFKSVYLKVNLVVTVVKTILKLSNDEFEAS